VRLRQIEEAVTPAAEAPAAQMSSEDRDRAGQLLREAEALVALADPAETETELARVRLAWAELGADTEIERRSASASNRRAKRPEKPFPNGSSNAPPNRSAPRPRRVNRPIACAWCRRSSSSRGPAPRIGLPS
jgi:hypothetical protein